MPSGAAAVHAQTHCRQRQNAILDTGKIALLVGMTSGISCVIWNGGCQICKSIALRGVARFTTTD
jgi:hypothetical protein